MQLNFLIIELPSLEETIQTWHEPLVHNKATPENF